MLVKVTLAAVNDKAPNLSLHYKRSLFLAHTKPKQV